MQVRGRTAQLIHSPIGQAFDLLAAHTPTRPLLNLSQAAPSFPPAPVVAERIAAVAFEEAGARYVPQQGLEPLRQALAAELTDDYPGSVKVDEVLITAGCNQAFCVMASALTEPGDNLVIALPYYFNHDMWLEVEGVERRYLEPRAGLVPTIEDAAALIDDRTRGIVLVSPGNPSGVTLAPDLLGAFFDLCVERDIMLVLDEDLPVLPRHQCSSPRALCPRRMARPSRHVAQLLEGSRDPRLSGRCRCRITSLACGSDEAC